MAVAAVVPVEEMDDMYITHYFPIFVLTVISCYILLDIILYICDPLFTCTAFLAAYQQSLW